MGDSCESGTFSDRASAASSISEPASVGIQATPESFCKRSEESECVAPSLDASLVRIPKRCIQDLTENTSLQVHKVGAIPTMEAPGSAQGVTKCAGTQTEDSPSPSNSPPSTNNQNGARGQGLDPNINNSDDAKSTNDSISGDGGPPPAEYERQDTTSSGASSASSGATTIELDCESFKFKFESSHSDETVRKLSEDATSLARDVAALKLSKKTPALYTVNEKAETNVLYQDKIT